MGESPPILRSRRPRRQSHHRCRIKSIDSSGLSDHVMKLGILLDCAVLMLLSLTALSCSHKGSAKEQKGRRQSFVLPNSDFSPFTIGQCAENGPVLFWSRDSANKNLPVWDSSVFYTFDLQARNLKELLRGTYGNIVCSPISHLFSVTLRNRDRKNLIVMDDTGKEHGRLEHPTGGSFIDAQWTPDAKEIVFEQDQPGLADDDPDFDPNGFTALGILNISDWKTRWFRINPTGYAFRLRSRNGVMYACISRDNPEGNPAKRKSDSVYDLATGQQIESNSELLAFCSESGHTYFASRQYEMPSPFQILESVTKRVVASFPATDSATHDALTAGPWNPKNDDLLAIERRSGLSNHLLGVDIYRVSQSKVIASFKTSAYAWTPDGQFLIIFQNGNFVFEPITV